MTGGWRKTVSRFFREALAVYLGLRDPRVPRTAKWAALAGLGYFLMPVDVIPDVIPVIGLLDDLLIIPLAARLAAALTPLAVMSELREKADVLMLRWGPKFFLGGAVFLAVWILLMGTAGWFLWQNIGRSPARPGPGQIVWPLPEAGDAPLSPASAAAP